MILTLKKTSGKVPKHPEGGSELEKATRAARDECGHFAQNQALLRTFWAYDPELFSRFWSRR